MSVVAKPPTSTAACHLSRRPGRPVAPARPQARGLYAAASQDKDGGTGALACAARLRCGCVRGLRYRAAMRGSIWKSGCAQQPGTSAWSTTFLHRRFRQRHSPDAVHVATDSGLVPVALACSDALTDDRRIVQACWIGPIWTLQEKVHLKLLMGSAQGTWTRTKTSVEGTIGCCLSMQRCIQRGEWLLQ